MLYDGGLLGSGTQWLVGIAIAAFLASIGLNFNSSDLDHEPRWKAYAKQVAIALLYLPLIPVLLQCLPGPLTGTQVLRYVVLPLVAVLAVLLHVTLYVWRSGTSLRHVPPKGSELAMTSINSTIVAYKKAITAAESNAKELAYIQHRIAPYFLSDSSLLSIAERRFGEGSPDADIYVAQHRARRVAFYAFLGAERTYREVYPRTRLRNYVETGTHADDKWPLTPNEVMDTLLRWAEALERYPSYHVAISDASIPIKYHVIDSEILVIHEPVGRPGDDRRLNSIMTYSKKIGREAMRDFDQIWADTAVEWRNSHTVANWIRSELVPLAATREEPRAGTESAEVTTVK